MTRPSIAVVDYGMGNLRSVGKALESAGARVSVTSSPAVVGRASGVVLPGVGAFGEASTRLRRLGLFSPLRRWIRAGRPFLGICLGFQLLFEQSDEFGRHEGLGCFKGRVVRFRRGLTVPHMGWNIVKPSRRSWLFRGQGPAPYFYFVHTFYPEPADRRVIAGRTTYGRAFVSAIRAGDVAGVQFHPEKSQRAGMTLLRGFLGRIKARG